MVPSFVKQTDEPLFPKVLWNRPTSQIGSGSLLLLGGNAGGFNIVQQTYQSAETSGIGHIQVGLPDSLVRAVGGETGIILPSTKSGSLSPAGLGQIESLARDFDVIGLTGDLSANSQTTVLIESLLTKLDLPVLLAGEALEIAARFYPEILVEQASLIIATLEQIIKIIDGLKIPVAIHATLLGKVEIVQRLADIIKKPLFVYGPEFIVAAESKISVTVAPLVKPSLIYGVAMTFWAQNQRVFEGLTTAAYVLSKLKPSAKIAEELAGLRAALDEF